MKQEIEYCTGHVNTGTKKWRPDMIVRRKEEKKGASPCMHYTIICKAAPCIFGRSACFLISHVTWSHSDGNQVFILHILYCRSKWKSACQWGVRKWNDPQMISSARTKAPARPSQQWLVPSTSTSEAQSLAVPCGAFVTNITAPLSTVWALYRDSTNDYNHMWGILSLTFNIMRVLVRLKWGCFLKFVLLLGAALLWSMQMRPRLLCSFWGAFQLIQAQRNLSLIHHLRVLYVDHYSLAWSWKLMFVGSSGQAPSAIKQYDMTEISGIANGLCTSMPRQ